MIQKLIRRLKLKQRFTVMIVPHSNSSVVRVNFTKALMIGVLIVVLVTASAAGFFVVKFNRMSENMVELDQLREINEEQKEQLDVLAVETEEIYSEIEKLRDLDRRVRDILNLDPREESSSMGAEELTAQGLTRTASAGGPVTRGTARNYADVIEGDLAYLRFELSQWEDNLTDLASQAEKHMAFLAARPAGWPARGRITSGFGSRRSPTGRGTEFHIGIDIANSRGTPIVATGSGRVISAGWRGGYGWTVVIEHGYGYQTLYAHASSIRVKTGDRVTRGTVIATMGTSGRATGPHVHYEVIYRGKNVDPAQFLRRN